MVGVSLLHRAGHFCQKLDEAGSQSELPVSWNVSDFLTEMPVGATIQIEGRRVGLRCWKYQVEGVAGYSVPVYLLDTDLPENSEWDRKQRRCYTEGMRITGCARRSCWALAA
jgi:glycogen phosphorylase